MYDTYLSHSVQEILRMRIFPLALKDKSKEWFKSVGKEFNFLE